MTMQRSTPPPLPGHLHYTTLQYTRQHKDGCCCPGWPPSFDHWWTTIIAEPDHYFEVFFSATTHTFFTLFFFTVRFSKELQQTLSKAWHFLGPWGPLSYLWYPPARAKNLITKIKFFYKGPFRDFLYECDLSFFYNMLHRGLKMLKKALWALNRP